MLALLLGWFVAGGILRPVRTITATARRISASNLQERPALDGADEEFKDRGDTLDELFSRLEAAFEAQRHFVANASHELRPPLENGPCSKWHVPAAPPSRCGGPPAKRLLASNEEQEQLIDALLALASSEGGLDQRERIELSSLCDSVLLRREADANAISRARTSRKSE